MKILKNIINKNLIKAKIIKISNKNTIKVKFNKQKLNKKYNKMVIKTVKKLIHSECTFLEKNNIILIKNLKHFSKKKTYKIIKIIK